MSGEGISLIRHGRPRSEPGRASRGRGPCKIGDIQIPKMLCAFRSFPPCIVASETEAGAVPPREHRQLTSQAAGAPREGFAGL